ncbi:hypothetical protein [Yersinia mollaretii]|uniref:DUF1120 domain-containing protein n=1 Tax=Yersinia mollaretii TaxID=33060 RepID=A0AA36LRN2_YERMO|nr:hypothetical protein [Yersinia mollaretii]MDA5527594.1 hypothetical protein [Yersinia mollaretii]MDR7875131.1 hypothetical protein [Yersinia mollaretii]PHZ32545.1 hypothetical protein CS537_05975 [Yersinia mollaretii]WQC74790.1 hypothetical protein U1Z61_20745 [Yersinia mollaretii]CND98580.1 Uncharacterised protein [Yersinia mollaretii]
MKTNLLTIALCSIIFTPYAFGAQQASIDVSGTVLPATCHVTMTTNSHTLDYTAHGALTNIEVDITAKQTLDYPFEIKCDDKALVGFTLQDNQEGTAFAAATRHDGRFGLGKIDKKSPEGKDYKVGAWRMKISDITLDGVSTESNLLKWRPSTTNQAFDPIPDYLNPDHEYAIIRDRSGQQHNIVAFKEMKGTIKTNVLLAPKSLEHVADEIDISGSATITIKYF